MVQSIRISFVLLFVFTLLLGLAYPGFITAISNTFMKPQAEGSLIVNNTSKIVGSSLIGQSFSDPKYFWGRLSATGPVPYNAAASSGSNLGSAAPNLETAVKDRIKALKTAQSGNQAIPVDLVTASASGLDPHISPEAAKYQIPRIMSSRNLSFDQVTNLIDQNTEGRQFGFLGEPRVNVLLLNKALDEISAK